MNRRTFFVSSVLSLASLLPARAADPNRRRPSVPELWVRTELYFGTNKPGGEISDDEFAGFMDREITPRFPDGLTLLTGYGQFLNSQGTLERERSKVLILFYPAQSEDTGKYIQEIRDAYKCAYNQESVLKVDGYAWVSF